jgi:hypothetical protein
MANTAINREMHDARRSVQIAIDAVLLEDWEKAEQALVDAQGRIGRLLRDIARKLKPPQFSEPPSSSPIKGPLG